MRFICFASGSGGNCALVDSRGSRVLIDAGISFKRIKDNLLLSGLDITQLDAVLITHEHSDHMAGLGTLIKRCGVPVIAPRTVANHLRCMLPEIEDRLREIAVDTDFLIGNLSVRAFHTPHDTDESVGYRICGDAIFALATDMGCVTDEIRRGLEGADAALIESNHDLDMLKNGPYPYPLKKRILSERGHLSNRDCAALARELADSGTKYIILGHLSRENNLPSLALKTVGAELEDTGARLYAACADRPFTLEI